jgi:hypothetical protein
VISYLKLADHVQTMMMLIMMRRQREREREELKCLILTGKSEMRESERRRMNASRFAGRK